MQAKSLQKLDGQIRRLQTQLAALGPMRPGTLTRQYRQPDRHKGPYYQLSYTYQMRSHTEYVRQSQVGIVREEIAAYRRYKQLTARWIHLALHRSRLRRRLASQSTRGKEAHKAAAKANLGRSNPEKP